MSALHIKKGSTKHSAYNLRPNFSDVQETHTLAVLVENEPGVLARVIGLFSGRGYNIDSLTVAEVDHQGHRSRITIVTNGPPPVIGGELRPPPMSRDEQKRRLQRLNLTPRLGGLGKPGMPSAQTSHYRERSVARSATFTRSVQPKQPRTPRKPEADDARSEALEEARLRLAEKRAAREEARRLAAEREAAKAAARRERNRRRNEAARVVQRHVRGSQSRAETERRRQHLLDAKARAREFAKANYIQSMLRGKEGRRMAAAARLRVYQTLAEAAAVAIQHRFRSHLRAAAARKAALRATLRENEVYFEAMRRRLKNDAAATLQRAWKSLLSRRAHAKFLRAVAAAKEEAARKLQGRYRRHRSGKDVRSRGAPRPSIRPADHARIQRRQNVPKKRVGGGFGDGSPKGSPAKVHSVFVVPPLPLA